MKNFNIFRVPWKIRLLGGGLEKPLGLARKKETGDTLMPTMNTWTLVYFFINFQFLEKDFLEDYLGQWQMEVERMENMTQTEKNRLLLSKQTIMGWKITSKRILIEIFILSVYNCEVWYCTCSCGMQLFASFSKMEPSSKCKKKNVY